jgi:hypothetical protein
MLGLLFRQAQAFLFSDAPAARSQNVIRQQRIEDRDSIPGGFSGPKSVFNRFRSLRTDSNHSSSSSSSSRDRPPVGSFATGSSRSGSGAFSREASVSILQRGAGFSPTRIAPSLFVDGLPPSNEPHRATNLSPSIEPLTEQRTFHRGRISGVGCARLLGISNIGTTNRPSIATPPTPPHCDELAQ